MRSPLSDAVRVTGLRLDAEIGVYPHEHGRKQRLEVDIELRTSLAEAGRSDDVKDTIDYDGLAAIARQVAGAGHHALIETIAHQVAERIFTQHSGRVRSVLVRVRKPGAVPDAETVEVEARRGLEDKPRRAELVLGRHRLKLGERALVMGIVNATPDSFFDRGKYFDARDPGPAIARAEAVIADGADVLDVGGETAQPSSPVLSAEEEIARVVPVISALAARTQVPISVDTYKPEVAERAIAAGASLINDTSGLADPRLADVAAKTGAGLVIMHIVGHPKERRTPGFADPIQAISDFLREKMAIAEGRGVPRERLLIDPGIGFGKTPSENLALIRDLAALHALDAAVLFACSRRTFLGDFFGGLPPEDRLEPTAAVNAAAMLAGAQMVRVHDVRFFARMSKTLSLVEQAQRPASTKV
ncbi:MAG: dihydropteroate synthase [Myxococcota bacterium]